MIIKISKKHQTHYKEKEVPLRAWITTLTRNHAIDILRKEIRDRKNNKTIPISSIVCYEESPSPEDLLVIKDTKDRVAQIVNTLPRFQRIIMEKIMANKSDEEIIKELDTSIERIKVATCLAKKTIKEKLKVNA